MEQKNESEAHRAKGNEHYKLGMKRMQANDPVALCRFAFEAAIKEYYSALRTASNLEDEGFAKKNLGMAHWRMAESVRPRSDPSRSDADILLVENDTDFAFRVHAWTGAVTYLYSAAESRLSDYSWTADVCVKADQSVEQALAAAIELPDDERKRNLLRSLSKITIPDKVARARILTRCARLEIDLAIPWISGSDAAQRRMGIPLLGVAENFITAALDSLEGRGRSQGKGGGAGAGAGGEERKWSSESEDQQEALTTELLALRTECGRLHAGVLAVAQRLEAERILNEAVSGDEALNMDGVYIAIDLFHFAMQTVRERDLQTEIMVRVALGRIFGKILRKFDKAREHYSAALELGESLGQNLEGQEWFETARQGAKQGLDSMLSPEEVEEMVKPDLEEIRKQSEKSAAAFVEWLLEKHPPRNVDPVKKEKLKIQKSADASAQRKGLTSILRYYHPDKLHSAGSLEQRKWNAIAHEVTSLINHKRDLLS